MCAVHRNICQLLLEKGMFSKPELVDLLDLMIFSMGYAEHIQDVSPEAKSNWENARREVSGLASQMVGTMAITALLDSEDGGDE